MCTISFHSASSQDASHALVDGMPGSNATSSGQLLLHHHHHHHLHLHHGEGGAGGGGVGGEKNGRSGQGQDHVNSNASPSNRKGHDEDRSLFSGVGQIVKRARRRVNSYLSALARQQRELARQQRERERTKSSAPPAFEDAEAAESLLENRNGEGGGGNQAGNDGFSAQGQGQGLLHRSQSAIFVGNGPLSLRDDSQKSPKALRQEQRESGNASIAIELANMEAGGGDFGDALEDVALGGGDEAAPLLPSEEAEFSGGGGVEVAGSLRRGHMRQTTGDLVRLHREEQQGAGEDSAQEDRERSRGAAGAQVSRRSGIICLRTFRLHSCDRTCKLCIFVVQVSRKSRIMCPPSILHSCTRACLS